MKTWLKSPLTWILLACFLMALFALSGLAKAADEVVQFPESELARESVLPVFDQPEAVKKRFVPTEGRIELGGFFGTSLNDPFLYSYPVGLEVQYHLSEIHAFGLMVVGYANSNTGYVSQIQGVNGATQKIPFTQNPSPTFTTLAEYEFTPYYGKISLTKQSVLNLNISATARAGMLNLSAGGSSATGGLGLNERFFFTRNFGIKLDLSTLFYTKPDVLGGSGTTTTVTELFITLGAVWLLPTL